MATLILTRLKRDEYGYKPSDIDMGYEAPDGRGGTILADFRESDAYQLARAERLGIKMRQECKAKLQWEGVDDKASSMLAQMLSTSIAHSMVQKDRQETELPFWERIQSNIDTINFVRPRHDIGP